jgi:glycosyltransferase involved in cell wall biosynthesis
MRIGFYTFSFLPIIGGAEILLHGLAESLTQRGHEVTVWAPKVRGEDNRVSARYRLCRYARPSSKRFGVRQTLPRVLLAAWGRRPDVLHCHGAYPAGYVGATFKRLTGVPLVIRPHGSDILPGEWIDRHPRLAPRMRHALLAADVIVAQGASLVERLRVGKPMRYSPNSFSCGPAWAAWAGSSSEPAALFQSIEVSRWQTAGDPRSLGFGSAW